MGSFYTPYTPYDLNTYLDNLPAYTLGEGVDQLLDTAREVTLAGDGTDYYFYGIPFPSKDNSALGALATFSGNVIIPALCYLVGITGDAFYNDPNNVGTFLTRSLEGFKFRIYDKGGKMDTVINSQFMRNSLFAPPDVRDVTYNNAIDPHGPYFPQSPMVVLEPGSVQMEITNMSQTPILGQVLFSLAVPLNRHSTNQMLVQGH